MNYGTQFSELEPTYMQVRDWDRNGVVLTHVLFSLERGSYLFRPSGHREGL